jgi:hypothetical protein
MSTLVAQTISNGTVSTSSENVIRGSARAWVNFTGSTAAIRGSYNISSVTRSAAGRWTINFTNAMANADYAVTLAGQDTSVGAQNTEALAIGSGGMATGSVAVTNIGFAGTFLDLPTVCVAIFST